ncbi:Hypothetical_protein [Hexamita inflata]|uniref:Hypothetical_protein n=1 Tax=Hexamita inflata TaxID=28002 RepID=A0AA86QI13_9EUKA|nr:Hypothetical protein HINF_LOCUS44277 [Hexamita inflata]
MFLLPNLVEITSEHSYKCDVAQHTQNVIKMRQKFQKMQQTNVKRIEKLTIKRDTKHQNLDELDDKFFYCFDVILDNFEGGTEQSLFLFLLKLVFMLIIFIYAHSVKTQQGPHWVVSGPVSPDLENYNLTYPVL